MATGISGATPTSALTLSPDTTPNLDHPETSKGPMTIAIGVIVPLTSLCFFLRTYVRIWVKRQWICEDCKHGLARSEQKLQGYTTATANKQTRARSICLGKSRPSFLPSHLPSNEQDVSGLTAQIGTITYCGTGAVTMAHHGGEHERDLTQAQLKEAYYVRT